MAYWPALIIGILAPLHGAETSRPVEITTEFIRFTLDPGRGGAITHLGYAVKPHNLAGEWGLLQEGFGVANEYIPNRRLNEHTEVIGAGEGASEIRYSYDCDGPNISGLHSTRIVRAIPGEASLSVTWRVENRGNKTHWIAPWVRNDIAAGGSVDAADRMDLPTINGVEQPLTSRYAPAARNWAAITDTSVQETVYGVFRADQLHSFQSVVDIEDAVFGFTAWFVPGVIKPGEVWETAYRICAVRGLAHVDFATDDLAAQLDYEIGTLTLLMSAAAPLGAGEIRASVLRGEPVPLAAKRFTLAPDQLVRCTYEWHAREEGAYDFLAEIKRGGVPYTLGRDTSPPHGGIDTQFVVGDRIGNHFEPWTDAPFQLDRGGRTMPRILAAVQPAAIWFESSLNKVFRQDRPEGNGRVEPRWKVTLARNESESFQIVIRPEDTMILEQVQVRCGPLTHAQSGAQLPPIRVERVDYVPVRVPTHFEHPTGDYPDPLLPFAPFTARGGVSTPLWLTVHAPIDVPPGNYSGIIEIFTANAEPAELWIEVEVLDVVLPDKPSFKSDFGISMDRAMRMAQARGYSGSREALAARYLDNAAAHRVTLRGLSQLPLPSPAFETELAAFRRRLPQLRKSGVTTIFAHRELLDTPARLKAVQEFADREQILDLLFCDFAFNPPRFAWPLVVDKGKEWNAAAPSLPLMASTHGIDPFIDPRFTIINAHTRVFDTTHNTELLNLIAEGHEVWWYVDGGPPRPYANFFIEFEGIEHRALFWQAWALGVRGMHYADVNAIAPGQNPFSGLLDDLPANGNGFLVYPGTDGPINSIRWDIIRDGIEDYEYLTLLTDRVRRLKERNGDVLALDRATTLLDLKSLVPNLTEFTRDAAAIEERRDAIGHMIAELDGILNAPR